MFFVFNCIIRNILLFKDPQVVGTHFVGNNSPDSFGSKYQLFFWELLILILGESIIFVEKTSVQKMS